MEIKTIHQAGFEEVLSASDPDSGMRAFIAIHSTRLGPALGGIRMLPYTDEAEALRDVLLLAKAMTYKAAAARLKLGGGKAVIIGDPYTRKTTRLLAAMGKFVHHLNGRYICAKDAGISVADLVEIGKATSYIAGLPEKSGGSDDPSPATAAGIVEGLKACLMHKFLRSDFKEVTVAIQGMGHVGFALAKILQREKARLIVSDIQRDMLERAKKSLNCTVVPPGEICSVEADIFAPCALGGVINDKTIPELKFKIIGGGANNQLADETKHDRELHRRGILYAPDFIINAGGLIHIYVRDILKEKDSSPWVKKIYGTLLEIFKTAKEKGIGTGQAANQLAESVLRSGI